MKYFHRSIEIGDPEAYLYLGEYYLNIERNPDLAIENFLKAVEYQYYNGYCKIGNYYYQQRDDIRLGMEYLEKAALHGDIESIARLGNHYREHRQFDQAREYYQRLKDLQAEDQANILMGKLYADMAGENNLEIARGYYKNLIKLNRPDAGYACDLLSSITPNPLQAHQYQLKAIELGEDQCLVKVARYYRRTHDYPLAKRYYRQALNSSEIVNKRFVNEYLDIDFDFLIAVRYRESLNYNNARVFNQRLRQSVMEEKSLVNQLLNYFPDDTLLDLIIKIVYLNDF